MRHATVPLILGKIASAFEAENIEILPVKGVLTAHLLYDDVALRPLPDIDLRIRRRDFRKAVGIARDRGWNPRTDSPVLWTALLSVDGWEVDVEATVGPPGLCALRVEDLLQRAQRCVDPLGIAHWEPEVNDHALVLALNAFKDGLGIMPWALEDLRRIPRHPRFDEDVLVLRAREGRVASALWIVADWLAERHGDVEWCAIRERVGPRPPSLRVARVYEALQERGWGAKPGLLVAAGGSDEGCRCAGGLALATAGIARRRLMLALWPGGPATRRH